MSSEPECRVRVNARARNNAVRNTPEPLESRRLFAVLFSEDFDGLAFGPNQEEGLAGTDVWTNEPPAGWTKDDTGVPGFDGPPENNGIKEWIGWNFAQKDWWVQTAGDQSRSFFTNASGGVMVADPDEWDDADHPGKTAGWPADLLYDATVTTPAISLANVVPGPALVEFDSSWRPEAFDDGQNLNNQTGIVEAIFSNGTTVELIHWDSDPFNTFFKGDNQNEAVDVPLEIPADATSVQLRFTLANAANDWWWAVDNLQVSAEVSGSSISDVYVRGSTWPGQDDDATSATFMEYLEQKGLGDDVLGYRLMGTGRTPPAGNPEDIIPWINADQIVVRYATAPTGAGVPTPGTLTVTGRNAAASSYAVNSVTPVPGDPTAFVLQLNKPLGGGDPVAGTAPTAAENGDYVTLGVPGGGAAGSDFTLRMNVLQGDTDHVNETADTHAVLARDFAEVKKKFFKSTTSPVTGTDTDYSAFHDVDGSGSILAIDFTEVKKRFFLTLRPPPAAPAAPGTAEVLRITSDLFGPTRVI